MILSVMAILRQQPCEPYPKLLHHLVHDRRCALRGGGIPQVLSGDRVCTDSERGLCNFGYAAAQDWGANRERSVHKPYAARWRRTRASYLRSERHFLSELRGLQT